MPEPRPDESKGDFIDRCMGDRESREDFPDAAQRRAFCESQWQRRGKMQWLKAPAVGRPIGVDREANVLRGFVVAQSGRFKSGRGEFTGKSLRQIAQHIRREPKGLKSRFSHPDLSNDGLGKFLGRVRDPFIVQLDEHTEAVRADLHFANSAFDTPSGNLAGHVMDLADEDPDAISSSLVLEPDEQFRLHKDGTAKEDENGNPLPPIWLIARLHASDVVEQGDAVDGLLSQQLSQEGLPDAVVRQAAMLLEQQFGGCSREFVEPRLLDWAHRVLDHYWPAERQDEDEQAAQDEVELLEAELMLEQP